MLVIDSSVQLLLLTLKKCSLILFVCLRLGDVASFFVFTTHDQLINVELLVPGDPDCHLFKCCR